MWIHAERFSSRTERSKEKEKHYLFSNSSLCLSTVPLSFVLSLLYVLLYPCRRWSHRCVPFVRPLQSPVAKLRNYTYQACGGVFLIYFHSSEKGRLIWNSSMKLATTFDEFGANRCKMRGLLENVHFISKVAETSPVSVSYEREIFLGSRTAWHRPDRTLR